MDSDGAYAESVVDKLAALVCLLSDTNVSAVMNKRRDARTASARRVVAEVAVHLGIKKSHVAKALNMSPSVLNHYENAFPSEETVELKRRTMEMVG